MKIVIMSWPCEHNTSSSLEYYNGDTQAYLYTPFHALLDIQYHRSPIPIRVNLNSGMSQVVLVLHMVSSTWFSVARGFICREKMHEVFIRLEKLHCRCGRCWPMDNDSYYYEVVFPHRGFPREIIVSILCCCLSDLFLLTFYYFCS